MSAPSLAHVVFSRLHLKVSATFLGFLLDSSVSWSFRVSILKQKWEENERMRVSKHSNILLVLMVESQCQCFPVESHNSKRMRFQGDCSDHFLLVFTTNSMWAFDLNVALARETPDLLNVAFLLIGPVTPRTLFDLRDNNSNHFSRQISVWDLQHFSIRGVRRTRSSNNPKRLTKTIISMK